MMHPESSSIPLPLLYIDDNENDRTLIQLAIKRETTAFMLYTADSVRSAKHFIDSDDPVHPRPALILLDYDMGEQTGADFLRWLRLTRHLAAVPVVMYSGSDGARNVAQCYGVGANHFLRKPTTFSAIQAIIRALHLCMTFAPPRLGVLAELAEYEPNPTAQHESPRWRGVRLNAST